ncbi:MAG: ABC transporter ATP-binding protein [Rhizobacter sp.]|nr:ABC transporter ATP-binding protein [Chlorobiales bacterium]
MSPTRNTASRAAIRLTGITKKFGAFTANRNISLDIQQGSIHAVVGENGAGKSTLMKILYGLYTPDAGTIEIGGEPARLRSPADAIALGLGMVHQHFMLVPTLTVAENVILGNEPADKRITIDFKNVHRSLALLSKQFGLDLNSEALVGSLSVGLQQRVEILKLLYRSASILILDEPTAVLTPLETEELFTTLRRLRAEGKTIVLITHKLDEVLAVSDRISIMRQGELVNTVETNTTTKESIAKQMVGRAVLMQVDKPEVLPEENVLEVSDVSLTLPDGVKVLDHLSFTVRAGEIYGIAGVEGNGQSELLKLLWGLAGESTLTGTVRIGGENLAGKTPKEIARLGVSHIPEDRLRYAVIKAYPVAENYIFGRHTESKFLAALGFNEKAVDEECREMITSFDVRAGNPNDSIGNLSGGNQQKIVAARELGRPQLRVLILAQPTRGVDIGAIEFIHRKIIETQGRGVAVLLVSAELEEVMSLSDRIGCIYKGTIKKEFSQAEVAEGRKDTKAFGRQLGVFIT